MPGRGLLFVRNFDLGKTAGGGSVHGGNYLCDLRLDESPKACPQDYNGENRRRYSEQEEGATQSLFA